MFSSLREKFQIVQEEIATGLKSLKIDRHGIRRKSEVVSPNSALPGMNSGSTVNYEAGIELLEYYHKYWKTIHQKTVDLAYSAQDAAVIIAQVHTNYERQWDQMGKLSLALAVIPKIVHGVQEASDLILNVQCAFDETDEALLELENMINTQELREKELEHRFQLALYRQKREDELDDLKVKLTNEHFAKIQAYEKRKSSEMKSRQAYFQEAFEKDLEQYKEGSLVSRVEARVATVKSPTLEEIELEEDTRCLEDFLAESGESTESVADIAAKIPPQTNKSSISVGSA